MAMPAATKSITEAFKQEMKEMGINNIDEDTIKDMIVEQYSKQQVDVDARSVEYEIRDAVINSRNNGNGTQS